MLHAIRMCTSGAGPGWRLRRLRRWARRSWSDLHPETLNARWYQDLVGLSENMAPFLLLSKEGFHLQNCFSFSLLGHLRPASDSCRCPGLSLSASTRANASSFTCDFLPTLNSDVIASDTFEANQLVESFRLDPMLSVAICTNSSRVD